VFAPQCLSTLAVVKRETNSWRYPLYMALYLFALAYAGAFLTTACAAARRRRGLEHRGMSAVLQLVLVQCWSRPARSTALAAAVGAPAPALPRRPGGCARRAHGALADGGAAACAVAARRRLRRLRATLYARRDLPNQTLVHLVVDDALLVAAERVARDHGRQKFTASALRRYS